LAAIRIERRAVAVAILVRIENAVQNSVCCSGAASRSSSARISLRSPS
jgi:hypothetical protein